MKKPKKFGAGGALAGLAGLGALAYMASKKGDKEDSGKSETYIDKQLKRAKEMPEPEPTPEKGIASDFKSSESKFERADNETSIPDKAPAKKASSSTAKSSGKSSGSMDSDIPKKESSYEDTKANIGNQSFAAPEAKKESVARTRAGTVVSRSSEPSAEDIAAAKAKGAEKLKKQYKENEFKFSTSKSPNRSYKSGGSIKSSASSRGDGCAMRGKTKGKIY